MQVLNEQEVAQNVRAIMQQVRDTALQAGRDPSEVQVMAVTKTVDPVLVNAAIGAGITLLGENKAQELCAKYDSYHKDGVQIHFIGHLQTNKVRQIVDKVSMVESVDSIKLAREIDRHCAAIGKVMDVLLEVNIGREENKTGVFPELLPALLEEAGKLEHIRVRGLMTIPPVCETEEEVLQYFSQMRQLFIDIKQKKYDNISMEILSMGMSADYLAAVRCGSNIVRIGTAMFGQRNYKRS
ncbi:MAG TPA: YggS family pyridoxal phosphate-dependent enzyme [Candidatus Negativibacillus faecipullorum]|nr:YggS family pyridoxal phosphate-dependent enzyme [Candidatus Negativibacillus faecipullorum]